MKKNQRNSFFPPKMMVLGLISVIIEQYYCGKKLLYSIFSAPFFNDFYDNPLPTKGAYDRSTFWLDTKKGMPKSLPSAPKIGTLLAEPIEGSYQFLSPSAPW